jgi:hypothetical protein
MRNITKSYKRAIEILTKEQIDFKKIVIKFAQERPDLFINYASSDEDDFINLIVQLGIQNQRVLAVKEYRKKFLVDLKTAIIACEKIWFDRGLNLTCKG